MQQQEIEQEQLQIHGNLRLRYELIENIFIYMETNQLIQFRCLNKWADLKIQEILNSRLNQIKKEIKKLEVLKNPILQYVYGELAGELNSEFLTIRMNIINAVNKMDFQSQKFKDVFEMNPVGIKISKYLKLLFQVIMKLYKDSKSRQFQRNNLHNYIQYQKLKMNYKEVQVFVKTYIIRLRSMRFMNEWHKQYKIDIICDELIEKQCQIEAISARIRQTQIEKIFLNI
ncbi:unnamed protein product [Paramecium sonneborni]|uniref:Uncharacterized protein n=1 Tax=Paramecium sonneborni TaxID=65129 RepID=A0A8S1QN70_9CILI|nr:unnamed protein product [Paramecium sonneborni]